MYHSFLIHSSASGHLGCLRVLAIVNSAVMNIGVHVSLSILVSSVCMPSSGRLSRLVIIFLSRSKHLLISWLQSKSLQEINAGEGVEKREPSYTVGGNAN